jgi:hypothetical protein
MIVVLSGTWVVRFLSIRGVTSCRRVACGYDGVATECALCLRTALNSASTRRFIFLVMPMRRDWAKSMREFSNDRKRMVSWVLALLVRSLVPRLALDNSTNGHSAERAEVGLSRV